MNKKTLTRKDFLKYLGGLAAAPFLLRIQNLINFGKQKGHMKEAKYYKPGKHLAG